MEAVKIVLELAVVLGAIVMGTRSSGVALGLWGGAGVAVLVFVFGEDVGSPPVDALLIVLSVVLASSMMQAAGGIDWMVTIAAKLIESRPKTWKRHCARPSPASTRPVPATKRTSPVSTQFALSPSRSTPCCSSRPTTRVGRTSPRPSPRQLNTVWASTRELATH